MPPKHTRPRSEKLTGRVDATPVRVAPGIARFRDPAERGRELPPFPGYVVQPRGADEAARATCDVRTRPRFSRVGTTARVLVGTSAGTSLYGTGAPAGSLLRNGTVATLYNYDAYDFTDKTATLYQSHPWVLGVRRDGTAFGVVIETTRRCVVDLRAGIDVRVEGASPAVMVIERDHPSKVVQALAELTGFMSLPPRWAMGYHQCRFSYESEAVVREVAAGFRGREIPCDAIWLDIDCMDGFRCFTLDQVRFPQPAALFDELHEAGFRAVAMVDPGLKVDPAYFAYREGRDGDHLLKGADGNEYHGKVWPGECAFPDFTMEPARRWWGELAAPLVELGIDGLWNDMNEPAIFWPAAGKTMPDDVRHRADESLGGDGDHARYHNVYGMLMSRATREGLEKLVPEKRPFVLTRASFIGGQRYAAAWSGDNRASEAHMRWSLSTALNMGLSGQPFSGPDIGGFIGETQPDLFARWMGLGTMLPFARAHKTQAAARHEPWSLGASCEATCRLAIQRRYRMMPYLSTLFWIAATQGLAIVRPLFFADATDLRLRSEDRAFLLGADVMVEPVWEDGRRAVMPRGVWREFDPLWSHGAARVWDPLLPRMRIRTGAIVPLGPITQHAVPGAFERLTLVVSPDDAGRAECVLYEDQGEGFGHREGQYLITTYRAKRDDDGWLVEVAESEGKWQRPSRSVEVVVLGSERPRVAVGSDGETIRVGA